MADFKNLLVWQRAHALALSVHEVCGQIRGAEYTALRSQAIRAAMSIGANIVEGRTQRTEKDFARFLRYAIASASELEYHLTVGHDMRVIATDHFDALMTRLVEVRKMLHGLLSKLDKPKEQPQSHPSSRR
jgi:four helix bundle protein